MFKIFKEIVQEQFKEMQKENVLFVTDTDKDEIWDIYLNSFPEGTNEIFRERREYACNCCKSFIRTVGNIVAIQNNKLVSIWDKIIDDGKFGIVSKALSEYVKSKKI